MGKIINRASLAIALEDFRTPLLKDDGSLGDYVLIKRNSGLLVRDFSYNKQGIVIKKDDLNYFVSYDDAFTYMKFNNSIQDTTPVSAIYLYNIDSERWSQYMIYWVLSLAFIGIIGMSLGAMVATILR